MVDLFSQLRHPEKKDINPNDFFLQEWICDNIDGALYVGHPLAKSKLCFYKVSTLTRCIICMCLLVLECTAAIAVSVSHWNNTTHLAHSFSQLAATRSIPITFFTAMTAADHLSGHFFWSRMTSMQLHNLGFLTIQTELSHVQAEVIRHKSCQYHPPLL